GDIGDQVNEWIKESHPVRALEMSREEAERLGAMALFGEKYGEWVRVVEVEDVSRELCGGTHVQNTAAIGIFTIVTEGSRAAHVRRVEALTGRAAIDWFRARSRELSEVGSLLGSEQDPVAGARRAQEQLASLQRSAKRAGSEDLSKQAEELAAGAKEIGGSRSWSGPAIERVRPAWSTTPTRSKPRPPKRRWALGPR